MASSVIEQIMSSRHHEIGENISNERHLHTGLTHAAHATEIVRLRVVIREASKVKCMFVVEIEKEPKVAV